MSRFIQIIFSIFLFFTIYNNNIAYAQSCAGSCGGSGGGCWCDDGCWTFGDCCPDICSTCPTQGPNTIANCGGGGGTVDPPPGAGCNIQASICQPGELAGPFTFVPKGIAPAHSCLLWGTGIEAAFIILYITESGPLNILIEGNNTGIGCLDVSIFNIPPGENPCAAIYQPGNEIACNLISPCQGCAEFGYVFDCAAQVAPPMVQAGDVIMIVVHDYSQDQSSFSLELAPPGQGAQTGPPDPTITPVSTLCLDGGTVQLEAVNMGGDWSGTGVTASGLFDPATAGVGVHVIDYTIGTDPCDGQDQTTIQVIDCSVCTMTSITTTIGACQQIDNTFSISGQVSFTVPPASGQLILQDCNGNTVSYPAPFTSPLNYSFTNLDADGTTNCFITAYFSADPACQITSTLYNNPECPCIPEDASFTYPSNQYCQNQPNPSPTVTGVTGGTFSSTAGLSINATTGVINLGASTPGTYTVSYQSPDPICFSVETFIITINPIPTVTVNDPTICAGQTVALNAGGANTYTWSPGTYLSGTTGVSVNATPPSTISYTVTGTNTATGCQNTDIATVTVNPLPTVDAGVNQSICVGANVTLTGSGNAASYTWNNGVTNGVAFSPGATNTYTVTGTSAAGCVNTDQVTVTVNPLPNVFAGNDFSVCSGSTITLNGSGANSYTWTNGVTNGVGFIPAGTATYTVTGTDVNGCVNTDAITVTVLNSAPINAGLDQTICNGENATITATGGVSYMWDNGLGAGASHNVSPTSTTTYIVNGEDANGCTGVDQVTITVNALPNVGAGPDQTVCENTTVTLIGTGATTYIWDNGVTNGTAFTPAVGSIVYTVIGTDANGCENTDQVTVTVNALPNVDAGVDQTVCENTTVTLTGTGAATYVWTGGVNNGVGFVPPLGVNTYTVTGTAANGCQNTDNVTVTVLENAPIDAGLNQVICNGETVTITATGGVIYTWDNGLGTGGSHNVSPTSTTTYIVNGEDTNGCTGVDQVTITVNALPNVDAGPNQTVCENTAVTLTGTGAATYAWDNSVTNGTAFTPAVGSIVYTVFGTDANGCENSDQVTITVNALPNVSAGSDQTVCENTTVTLTGTGAATFSWTGGVNNGVGFIPPVGVNTYTVTGTAASGCQNTDDVTITVNALPNVTAGVDQTVCDGTNVTLSGGGALSYTWTGGITNNVSFSQPVGTVNYTVTGTDANGCQNTDQVQVAVNPNPSPVIQGADEYCAGTTATLSTTQPYASYNWSTGATTVTVGVTEVDNPITVTVTNAFGCFATSDAFTVTENSIITANYSETICQGESVLIHGNMESVAGMYSETFVSASGCDSISNVTLVVNALPNVNAGTDQAMCIGNNVILTASGAQTYVWNNSVTNGVPFTQPIGTVTYTVTGTDANGCVNTSDVEVVIHPLPIIDAGVNQTICIGESVVLSGTGAQTYTWNNGVTDGITFSPTNTDNYTVTGTDVNGCVNTDQVTVTVNTLPNVDAGPNQTVCEGVQVTLNGSGATSYAWDNGVTNGVAFTQAVGTVTYTVTGTDGNGCENTDQVNVTVNPLPNVNAGIDQAVCVGTSVTLNGSGAVSYVWDNGITNGIAFSPTNTNTYTVTGTDANGCVNTDDVEVVVHALPIVNAGADQTICIGEGVMLSGAGAQTYTWNNGVTDGIAFTPTNTDTYTVTGTDVNGCVNTDQAIVTVNALPNVDAGPNQTVCEGVQVILNGSGATSYVWDNGVTNGVAFTQAVGTVTYIVTGTDANGCENTDQVNVTVNPLPNVNAGADQAICNGSSVTLNGAGAVSYVWDNSVTNGMAFSPTYTNTYTVTGTDTNGCENTDQVVVTVNPLPTATIGGTTDVCINAGSPQITFTGANGAAPYTFTYDINGAGNQTVTTGGGSNTVTVNVPTGAAGTYTYNLVSVTDASATTCSQAQMGSAVVTVHDLPNVFAGNDLTICEGQTATLTASGAQTYVWDNGVTNSVPFTPTSTTTYTVTGTSVAGCENTDDVTITVVPTPVVSFTGVDLIGCAPVSPSLTNTSPGNFTSCEWNFSNGQTLNGCANVSSVFTIAGCYDVTLTVTTPEGCSNSMTVADYVCVEPDPVANFTANPNAMTSVDPTTQFINLSLGASDYEWVFGDDSPLSNEISPIHDYGDEPGTYIVTLTVYSPAGCIDSTSQVVTVTEELIFYVPNTFTPDGDTYNEEFKPIFHSGFDPFNYNLLIFNRWGEVLFESNNAEKGWDGTYGGQIMQDGVYIWKIVFKRTGVDDREEYIGHVNLMR